MRTRRSLGILTLAAVAPLLVAPIAGAETRIRERKENQQKRIAQGVASGELTPRETARLERQEGRLDHEIRDMRRDDGGRLTPKDRRVVNRQQNRISRHIYRQKHDGQKQ
jgi:gas vesicle protein